MIKKKGKILWFQEITIICYTSSEIVRKAVNFVHGTHRISRFPLPVHNFACSNLKNYQFNVVIFFKKICFQKWNVTQIT